MILGDMLFPSIAVCITGHHYPSVFKAELQYSTLLVDSTFSLILRFSRNVIHHVRGWCKHIAFSLTDRRWASTAFEFGLCPACILDLTNHILKIPIGITMFLSRLMPRMPDFADGYRLGPDGEPFEIFFEISLNPLFAQPAELISQHLEAVGLRTPLKQIESGLWTERRNANELYNNPA